jgi:hypothetical protein
MGHGQPYQGSTPRVRSYGFTRVRKARFKENVNWVKHVFHDTEEPTHIALYDISLMKCLQEIGLEPSGLNVVFSIFSADV